MPTRFSFVVRAVPRTRQQLARRPWIRWVTAAALAVVVGWSVATALAKVERDRDSWGTRRATVVAAAPAAAGDPLQVITRELPLAMLPDRALADIAPGSIARRSVVAGQVLTDLDVSATGPDGWLPAGWIVLIVSADPPPAAAPGDPVRIFADGVAIGDGQVVARADTTVSVGVPPEIAAAAAQAAAARTAVLGSLV